MKKKNNPDFFCYVTIFITWIMIFSKLMSKDCAFTNKVFKSWNKLKKKILFYLIENLHSFEDLVLLHIFCCFICFGMLRSCCRITYFRYCHIVLYVVPITSSYSWNLCLLWLLFLQVYWGFLFIFLFLFLRTPSTYFPLFYSHVSKYFSLTFSWN